MEGRSGQVNIEKLTKSYGDHKVLDQWSLTFQDGKIYALMGPSGCGKTTFLHILLGIVEKDGGTMEGVEGKHFSAAFQENRLFEFLTAAENILAVQRKIRKKQKKQKVEGTERDKEIKKTEGTEVIKGIEEINEILAEILPKEALIQKVGEYSGGMKRRVAIARAMLAESDVIVMDEPLTGLDEGTRDQVIEFILKYRRGRTLIFSTHQEKEAELLGGEKIVIAWESLRKK
ncbi:ATP-binding cassette domain-containing protein [Blautia schinkii]|nr:ATP-binding cassette domain-containing protein [Blautia schinkii]